MNKNQKVSAKNQTKKENLDQESLVAGALIGSSVPSTEALTAPQNELQAKLKSKKAVDAELIKEDQGESAVNQKVEDIEQTEVVMVDATVVELELTSDVKKDCKINSKGVEECDDGIGWWWLAGLPLLALGGGGGGGGAAPAPAPVSSDTYRHNDFSHFSIVAEDELVIANTSDSTVEVVLAGDEHVELQNITAVQALLTSLAIVQDAATAAQSAADDADAALDLDPGNAGLITAADDAAIALESALDVLATAESDLLDSEDLADIVYALSLYPTGDWSETFNDVLGDTYADLTAAIRTQNADGVQASLEALLPALVIVTRKYEQNINFEGSDGIREFTLFVENADDVELDIDYSAAQDLETVLVEVSGESTLTFSGGSLVNLSDYSGSSIDDRSIDINVLENSNLYVIGRSVNVAAIVGNNNEVNLKVDGDSFLTFSGGSSGLFAPSIGIAADGNNAEINVDILDGSYAGISLNGGEDSNFVYVIGNSAEVNFTIDESSGGFSFTDNGIDRSSSREFSGGAFNRDIIASGNSLIAVDGDDAAVNLTVTNDADLDISGGENNGSAIAVDGDRAVVTVTVLNNNSSGIYVSGGDLVNILGNQSSVNLVVGNYADNETFEGETLYSGSSYITAFDEHADIVRILGSDATVNIDMNRESEIAVYGSGGDVVNITGNNATVDIDIEAMAADGDGHIHLGSFSGGNTNFSGGRFSGGFYLNTEWADTKNIIDIDGDAATVTLDATIETGHLEIEISDGNVVDIQGNDADVRLNFVSQFDSNTQGWGEDDPYISASSSGGSLVRIVGDSSFTQINATANVDITNPFISPNSLSIGLNTSGGDNRLVEVDGDESVVDINLIGGVEIQGRDLIQISGDDAVVTFNVDNSLVLGSHSLAADFDVSGGISVFGNNANVTFSVTGELQENRIEWDDDASLINVATSNVEDDTGSTITVDIENSRMSGGYLAELNGDNGLVDVTLEDVNGAFGGVLLNGSDSDVFFDIKNSQKIALTGADGVNSAADDVAVQLLALNGDENKYTYTMNRVNMLVEPTVDIFEVDGVQNIGTITISNSEIDSYFSGGRYSTDSTDVVSESVDHSNVLFVNGTLNVTTLNLNTTNIDLSEGTLVSIDGSDNVTTVNLRKSNIDLGSTDDFTINEANFNYVGSELFTIDGNSNELVFNLGSDTTRDSSDLINADDDFSEIYGDDNTVTINLLRTSEADIGVSIDGEGNTLNLNFDQEELDVGDATVTFNLQRALNTTINIDGSRSEFAIGDGDDSTLGHTNSFIDADLTTINLDLENNSIMAFYAELVSTGDDYDTTLNIDSDGSIFAIEFDVESGHDLDINVKDVDDNHVVYAATNSPNTLRHSYIELDIASGGDVNIDNTSGTEDIYTIIYGEGNISLATSDNHQDGNYDHIYIDSTRDLKVDDFETEFDRIHLATNLWAGAQRDADPETIGFQNLYGNTGSANWFDLDAFKNGVSVDFDLLQDVAHRSYNNAGAAVIYTDSMGGPLLSASDDKDGTSVGLEVWNDENGDPSGGIWYDYESTSLESLYGANIYWMNWDENEEDSLGDLEIWKWLDNDGYSTNNSLLADLDDNPTGWYLMTTIYNIENVAYNFGLDNSLSNNFIGNSTYDGLGRANDGDLAYDNNGALLDDHHSNGIINFTVIDSYLDNWQVFGV